MEGGRESAPCEATQGRWPGWDSRDGGVVSFWLNLSHLAQRGTFREEEHKDSIVYRRLGLMAGRVFDDYDGKIQDHMFSFPVLRGECGFVMWSFALCATPTTYACLGTWPLEARHAART